MSNEREEHDGESTEDLHRELGDLTEPDSSAGLEGRLERSQELPDHIGPFKIFEILGEGGMGIVYLAEQTKPIRRRVALKLVKLGMDTKQVIARFESERQALALMNHPNVAKVFDAGAAPDGRPYFVMEHVPGVPITEYCDQQRLNTSERLGLFDKVCHAVQHAHQKGIIHRDIKPSNILVMVRDGQPVPKVIDFGVAKATQQPLTEKTLFTEQGQLIGTPEYMSPEQAEMTALDIDTRTDIYSLGVVLYELLAGALPFEPQSLRRAGFAEIQRIIREEEPPKPSTRLSSLGDESGTVARKRRVDIASLTRQLRGDLDWITMKALDKDRTRRYATAAEFADDIGRHLNHEPVRASPPSATYRFKKFVQRKKGILTSLAAIIILLLAGIILSTIQYLEADSARSEAERARYDAEQLVALYRGSTSYSGAARKLQEEGRYAEAEELLRERLEIMQRLFGKKDRATIKAKNQLAALLIDEGRYSESEELLRDLLDSARSLPVTGLSDQMATLFDTQRILRDLMELCCDLGRYAEAEELLRKLQGIAERMASEESDPLEKMLTSLSPSDFGEIGAKLLLLQKQGRWAEAEALFKETLQSPMMSAIMGMFGQDNSWLLLFESDTDLTYLVAKQGRYDEAEELYRTSVDKINELNLKENRKYRKKVAHTLGGFAYVLEQTKRFAEAESFCRDAKTIWDRMAPGGYRSRNLNENLLGGILVGQSRFAEAEPLSLESYAKLKNDPGLLTQELTEALHRLVRLYESWDAAKPGQGYAEKAAEWRAKLDEEATEPRSDEGK